MEFFTAIEAPIDTEAAHKATSPRRAGGAGRALGLAMFWGFGACVLGACGDSGTGDASTNAEQPIEVTRPDGTAALGASVYFLASAEWRAADGLRAQHPTPWDAALAAGERFDVGADGRGSVPQGSGFLLAVADEAIAVATMSPPRRDSDTRPTLTLRLHPEQRISIQALSVDGSAAAALPVALHATDGTEPPPLAPPMWNWHTDAQGRAEVRFVAPEIEPQPTEPPPAKQKGLVVSVPIPGILGLWPVDPDRSAAEVRLPPLGSVVVSVEHKPWAVPQLRLRRLSRSESPTMRPSGPREWPTPERIDDSVYRFWPVPVGAELQVVADRRYFDAVDFAGPQEDGGSVSIVLPPREPAPTEGSK